MAMRSARRTVIPHLNDSTLQIGGHPFSWSHDSEQRYVF
jgi:hypothetical protein